MVGGLCENNASWRGSGFLVDRDLSRLQHKAKLGPKVYAPRCELSSPVIFRVLRDEGAQAKDLHVVRGFLLVVQGVSDDCFWI